MVVAVPRAQAGAVATVAGLPVWHLGEVVESGGGERVTLA
jgi:hypothetical protein